MMESAPQSFSAVVLGDLCIDIVAQEPLPFSLHGDLDEEPAVWLPLAELPGGSAYHFARWAQRYGLKPLVVGCVGGDLAGESMAEALDKEGIAARLQRSSAATARVFIAYDPKGYRILFASSASANNDLTPEFVQRSWSVFDHYDMLWLSGLCLRHRDAIRMSAVVEAVKFARRDGALVILDVVPHDFRKHFGSVGEVESTVGEIDGVVSDLASARRLLRLGSPGEQLGRIELQETIDQILRFTDLAVLRHLDRDGQQYLQIARSSDGFHAEWTHPLSEVHELRGYGDALACEALTAFLRVRAPRKNGEPARPMETSR
jgi:sugar/nucleoside kinase (ribokinase family)